MSFEPVDIYVRAGSEQHPPLSGVLVRVFSSDGNVPFTQGLTDSDGKVSFLLESGFDYQVRFFKFQVEFGAPLLINVVSNPPSLLTNTFDVYGKTIEPPTSTNPWVCVAYGYFRKQTLSAAPNTEIHFIGKFNPIMVDGSAVVSERSIVHTDQNGYVQVNLIRCAQYDVILAGMEDVVRTIYVPDAPNVNLPDLLFPIVDSVSFEEDPPYTVQVKQRLYLTPTVTSSSGNLLQGVARGDVTWSVSDDSVVMLDVSDTQIILTGRAEGTSQLIARRVDQSIIRLPYVDIKGQPVDVAVTL